MYVSSRASEASAAAPSPYPGGTPGTGKTLGDAEYRDTVLYLQQRQQMNHQEVMAAIRDLAARVTGGGGGGGGGAMQRSPAPHRGGDYPSPSSDAARSAALGLADVEGSQVPVGAAYAAMMVSPASGPTFTQVRDAELDAARARIAALEAQVRGLKDQLESKEGTIRRLSEAALREVTSRAPAAPRSGAAPRHRRLHHEPRRPRSRRLACGSNVDGARHLHHRVHSRNAGAARPPMPAAAECNAVQRPDSHCANPRLRSVVSGTRPSSEDNAPLY
jgi:hypothetical protein